MARQSGRGSTTSDSISKRRAERRAARGTSVPAEWGNVDAERILALIAAVTSQGGLCSFGYTRDGGAFTITVIIEGDKQTDYIRPTEDVNSVLDILIDDYRDA